MTFQVKLPHLQIFFLIIFLTTLLKADHDVLLCLFFYVIRYLMFF